MSLIRLSLSKVRGTYNLLKLSVVSRKGAVNSSMSWQNLNLFLWLFGVVTGFYRFHSTRSINSILSDVTPIIFGKFSLNSLLIPLCLAAVMRFHWYQRRSCITHGIIHVSVMSHGLDFSRNHATINNIYVCYSKLMKRLNLCQIIKWLLIVSKVLVLLNSLHN